MVGRALSWTSGPATAHRDRFLIGRQAGRGTEVSPQGVRYRQGRTLSSVILGLDPRIHASAMSGGWGTARNKRTGGRP
ncbi:hypothetical protein GCM10007923_53360 [Shinella yambaruensis]|uniref:Uncharacterized protein n=1 Tax=Shinella yambaruensis TaxID=415996 RepID=A0ABQ5ZMM8_9HYPH|nr:hypothetical protein GCM10007923_53360 [Shinella yambaruensis]